MDKRGPDGLPLVSARRKGRSAQTAVLAGGDSAEAGPGGEDWLAMAGLRLAGRAAFLGAAAAGAGCLGLPALVFAVFFMALPRRFCAFSHARS